MSDHLDLRQRIASLSIEQRAELERRLMESVPVDRARAGIPRRGPAATCPMSFGQQRLWVLQQLEPDLIAYNVPRATRIEGPLDASALLRSLDALVERHESLRTTFTAVEGEPVQVVGPPRPVQCPIVDLSALEPAARSAELARQLRDEARATFDLSRDLMFRGRLIRLGPAEHVLALTVHHIASDGLSGGILDRELAALYTAFAAGERSPLRPLPIQYADYALWHRRWFEAAAEEQMRYWRDRLEGMPSVLDLPADRVRPAVATYRGGRCTDVLPPELVAAVGALGRRFRATPFMVLLAAFKVLIARYTHQPDVVVGTAIAGRTRVETEELIGFFVNTLVLRTDLSGDPTVAELVERVRQTALGAYGHQEMPFERLVQEMKPERLLDRSPLVQVSFVMQEAARAPLPLPGLVTTALEVSAESAPYDLAVSLVPAAGQITMRASYSSDLFAGETIARLLGHYRRLLEGIVTDPLRRISALPLLGADERDQIVRGWNPPAAPTPDHMTASDLFESQVRRTPDAVAVDAGGKRLTYAELDTRAAQLARRLRGEGVGPDVLVGVCLDRSLDMVAALLAVWKAGGAYVPLDPTYPAQRLATMLAESGAPVVLTQSHLRSRLPTTSARAICLDTEDMGNRAALTSIPGPAPDPDCLAYVAYTSGSTGGPKGVMVTHRGLVNYLRWAIAAYGATGGGGAPVASSIAFDLTVTSLFAPLLAGGPVLLVPDGPGVDGLANALRSGAGMSLVKLTPSHLELLSAELSPEEAAGRARALVIGGEALTASQLGFWRAHAPETRLINEYGPTETVVGCAVYEVHGSDPISDNVPIGRPIANMRLHVLDDRLEPVPAGVAGELYIGGVGVARGYWRRPDLTAERFVPDPFGAGPGERLYRTGDLARYLPEGVLEFLGRRDDQVKLRGYRIELGEIRTALSAHPDVGECAVLIREDAPGDARIVAYAVPRPGAGASTDLLRSFLADRLPGYMVPAQVVLLDALPLTVNGKVDRARLPAPDRSGDAELSPDDTPRTSVEAQLAALCADVLQTGRVGVHANFFAMGGHSLLAVRLIARIAGVFGVSVPLRRVFERPTVAGLTEAIEAMRLEVTGRAASPVQRVPRREPLPLSWSQEQFWLINQEDPGDPTYNSSYAMRLRGPLAIDALREALTELVARHEVLRTVFALVDGHPRQTASAPATFDLPVVEVDAGPDAEERCRRSIGEEMARPFDLGRDRLLRGRVLRLGARDHILVLVMHHIAADAWSSPILFSELSALYEAARAGKPSPLPPLPVQYADFAVWQRQHLSGEALAAQVDYWTRRLAGAPAALELPTDRPRQPRRSPGAQLQQVLPASLTADLRALGARAGATPFMTLLAGFAALLHRYTGADDIVVGAPVLTRDRGDVGALIGCFVNMIALRVDLSGDPPFAELLERVRAAALEAYDHKDAPFARVVEALRPARMAGRTPVFQVVLNMRDFGDAGLRLAGLETEPAPRPHLGAMFDLMLFHHEVPDGGIRLAMQYAVDLFDAPTVARLLGHLQTLLEGAVADPARRLSRLPLLTEPERRALAAWNDTARPDVETGVLHEMFEAQADLRPAAPAAVHAGRELTYGEIEERANRLAHHLRRMGAGPDVAVGLCVERSLEMIVGVLGILKSGAGYVPLDPNYPAERLLHMMAAVDMALVVTHRATTDRWPAPPPDGPAPRVVCLDRDAAAIAAAPAARPRGGARSESLVYVLFTSGSTGRPKGVAMTHAPLVNLMHWQHARSACGVGARTLQFAPYGFDVSCQELFATLGTGGTLVIVDDDTRLDPEALLEVMVAERVERAFMPFVALEQLAQAAVARDRMPASLREVATAGEALRITPALAAMFGRLPGSRLDDQYGPTECHVVSAHMLEGPPEYWPALPPIGRPVANTALHVLGAGGDPLPVGVAGELWVGGIALARGYVGRPDLTAERFVADHIGGAPGALLYRTGDLARWTADGCLEYLGRVDQQVKVRGYRVEPGEIEAALEQATDAVAEAVVVAHGDAAGARRLVAYLRPAAADRPAAATLRAALRASLPDYMIPSAFEWVEAWPMTASGKVDRRVLAARTPSGGDRGDDTGGRRVRPKNPLEVELVGIWEELLGVRPIGVTDDFFELGGHSLLAVRMLRQVEQVCGRRVPVAALFAGASVRHLAGVIRSEAMDFYRTPVTLVQEGSHPALFFLHGDYNGGGFYCISLARALDPEQTFYALHPQGPDGQAVPATIEDMAEAHLQTVRRLQPHGPYYLGGHCNGGLIAYEMARRLRGQGETVAFLGILDASAMSVQLRSALSRARRGATALASSGRYYARRARRILKAGPAEWVPFVQRQIAGRGGAPEAQPTAEETRPELDQAYRRAIRMYVPGRYDGRVTVFKAAEYRAPRPDIGWGLVCDDVECHEIPGTHLSFITRHVATLGERLRACLRTARGE